MIFVLESVVRVLQHYAELEKISLGFIGWIENIADVKYELCIFLDF